MVKLQPKKKCCINEEQKWGTTSKISIFPQVWETRTKDFLWFFWNSILFPQLGVSHQIKYYIWQFPDKNQQTQPLGPISVGGFSLWGLSKSQRPFSAGNVTILFETHWWWCWQSHSHGLTVHSPDQWEWSTTLITKKQPHTDTQAWIW